MQGRHHQVESPIAHRQNDWPSFDLGLQWPPDRRQDHISGPLNAGDGPGAIPGLFFSEVAPPVFRDLIMPVVDERLIAKAKTLRAQGMTQDEIAVELGVVQSTVSTILRQHGLGGKLVKAQKLRRRS